MEVFYPLYARLLPALYKSLPALYKSFSCFVQVFYQFCTSLLPALYLLCTSCKPLYLVQDFYLLYTRLYLLCKNPFLPALYKTFTTLSLLLRDLLPGYSCVAQVLYLLCISLYLLCKSLFLRIPPTKLYLIFKYFH